MAPFGEIGQLLPSVDIMKYDYVGRNALKCALDRGDLEFITRLQTKLNSGMQITSFIQSNHLETNLIKMLADSIQASNLAKFESMAKIAPPNPDPDGTLLIAIVNKIATLDFSKWMTAWKSFHPAPNFKTLLHPSSGSFVLGILGQPDAVVAAKLRYFYEIDPTVDLSSKDQYGRDTLYIAKAYGKKETAKFLTDHGQKPQKTLYDFCLAGESSLRAALLSNRVYPINPVGKSDSETLSGCIARLPSGQSTKFLLIMIANKNFDQNISEVIFRQTWKKLTPQDFSTLASYFEKPHGSDANGKYYNFGLNGIISEHDLFASGRIDLIQPYYAVMWQSVPTYQIDTGRAFLSACEAPNSDQVMRYLVKDFHLSIPAGYAQAYRSEDEAFVRRYNENVTKIGECLVVGRHNTFLPKFYAEYARNEEFSAGIGYLASLAISQEFLDTLKIIAEINPEALRPSSLLDLPERAVSPNGKLDHNAIKIIEYIIPELKKNIKQPSYDVDGSLCRLSGPQETPWVASLLKAINTYLAGRYVLNVDWGTYPYGTCLTPRNKTP